MESLLELREKGSLTRALILLELLKGRKKLREISSDLKITPQGASNYIKVLQKEDLVDRRGYPTPKGIAFLQKFLAGMLNFVENAYDEMGFISTCEAVASERIKKDDKVYLIMRNGILTASKKTKSESSGYAVTDADSGKALIIKNMEGIINYKIGELYVLPINYDDYISRNDHKKLKDFIRERKVSLVGAYGIMAKAFCDEMSIEADVYAPVEACIEAAVKGINSMLIYSPEMARFFFQKIAANVNKYKVNPRFVEL